MIKKLKKILITGTSSGLGKSIALKLLKHDFLVIGISRKHTIKNKRYISYSQDIRDLKGFSSLLEEINKKHKDIYGIVSNAGEGAFNKLENFSDTQVLNFLVITKTRRNKTAAPITIPITVFWFEDEGGAISMDLFGKELSAVHNYSA